MPSGYTCGIEKGITFKEFALGCARAFGAKAIEEEIERAKSRTNWIQALKKSLAEEE